MMRKLLLFVALVLTGYSSQGQAYIPMPVDSAVWRYRIYDFDYIIQVSDGILFMNGTDTFANGKSYHTVMSRIFRRVVSPDSLPPVIQDVEASLSDLKYGGIRESGKKVYLLTLTSEELIYDFNAAVGDSIPAYNGRVRVTNIDSVLLGGAYHKRYLTTDPAYYVIEGVGSSEGLIPDINDGTGNTQFMCFTHLPVTYAPDTAVPCTYVYPIGHAAEVKGAGVHDNEVTVFPQPASGELHILSPGGSVLHAELYNALGQVMWSGTVTGGQVITVYAWPRGIYFLRVTDGISVHTVKKIMVN